MKRSSVIALGAAGLVAGTAYWSHPKRPAYCDDPNRAALRTTDPVLAAQQDQACAAADRRSGYSHSSRSSSGYYSWGSSSSSNSTVSRGGFGSTGHSLGASS